MCKQPNNSPDNELREKSLSELDKILNDLAREVQWDKQYKRNRLTVAQNLYKLQIWIQFVIEKVEAKEIEILLKPFYNKIEQIDQQIQRSIYNEACSELLSYIPKNIEQWDSTKQNFREWIQAQLKDNFFFKAVTENIDSLRENSLFLIVSLDELNNVISKENFLNDLYFEQVKNFIEQTPKIKDTRLREKPEITFQWLLLERLNGKTWENISNEVDVKVGTLSSFYSRSLRKFRPLFDEFI